MVQVPDANAASGAPAHNTAETLSVEAAGVEFAYRRFGSPAELPLVMLQHFRGNLDNWDPALTDALAVEREVILTGSWLPMTADEGAKGARIFSI